MIPIYLVFLLSMYMKLLNIYYIGHRRNFRVTGGPDPPLSEWEDGPPLYKYTKSEILLGPLTFQTKVTPLI